MTILNGAELYGTLVDASFGASYDESLTKRLSKVRRIVLNKINKETNMYEIDGKERSELHKTINDVWSQLYDSCSKVSEHRKETLDKTLGKLEDFYIQIEDDIMEEYRQECEEQDRIAMEDWESEKEIHQCCHWWTCNGSCPNFDPNWCI